MNQVQNSYHVKLVGQYYNLCCIIIQISPTTYKNQYGAIYQYVEQNGKKYLISGDEMLEIQTMVENIMYPSIKHNRFA